MPRSQDLFSHIREALVAGTLDDTLFDELLPRSVRSRSKNYWTPLTVARRAAALFQQHGARRVLDVGCGPGKFCLVGAATQPAVSFFGIEQRPHLVEAANRAASLLNLPNASFLCRDAFRCSWREFDGLYFFNPFWENVACDEDRYDESVELSVGRFLGEWRRAGIALRALPVGATVITYHGIGTPIPSSFELVRHERAGSDSLRVWQRGSEVDREWHYLETDEGARRVGPAELEAIENRWKACDDGEPSAPASAGHDRRGASAGE